MLVWIGGIILIDAKNIIYEYEEEKNKKILNDISVEIKKGEFVSILGHNGSGKSTLVKTFNGILLPCGGKIYVDKMDTANEKLIYEIRRRVGMVFQNPDNQIVATIVEEDVAFGPENIGIENKEIKRRVDEALKAVDMLAYRGYAPHMLSGGQKQRIAIAGILAMEPEYIILDESTAMLDPIGRADVIKTIKKLNKEKKITVILITHYMDEAALSDRIIVLEKGKIKLTGTPKEIFAKNEEMKRLKLGVPVTSELSLELNKRSIAFENCLSVDEFIENLDKVMES